MPWPTNGDKHEREKRDDMTDKIEFTLEDIKALNFFEPQHALDSLNEMLTEKIAIVTERMEQTYCKHDNVKYDRSADVHACLHCNRTWL